MRRPVLPEHASRLINHGPTVLVSSAAGGRRDVMAAAWSMPVEFVPPRVAVVIDKSTFTRELVLASGAFALSVACRAIADLAYTVGSVSGRDLAAADPPTDKFERWRIGAFDGPSLGLPLVEGCVGWLECRLIDEPHAQQAYDTFFGEVVSAQADARVFADGRWSLREDNAPLHTLHHLGAGLFAPGGVPVQARMLDPAAPPSGAAPAGPLVEVEGWPRARAAGGEALSFRIGPGLAFVRGGEGAGKTTLLRAIAGEIAPPAGRLVVRASSVHRFDAAEPRLDDPRPAREWLAARRPNGRCSRRSRFFPTSTRRRSCSRPARVASSRCSTRSPAARRWCCSRCRSPRSTRGRARRSRAGSPTRRAIRCAASCWPTTSGPRGWTTCRGSRTSTSATERPRPARRGATTPGRPAV